jgi:hypothetical protein
LSCREEDIPEGNVPRLILSQLRWLDHLEESESFARKLIEILRVCTPHLKKEIISVIPEIIDDFGHSVSYNSKSLIIRDFVCDIKLFVTDHHHHHHYLLFTDGHLLPVCRLYFVME